MNGSSWVFCMAFILADPSAKLWRPLHGGNNWRYRSSRKESTVTFEQWSWTFLTALTISIKQSWSLGWAPRLNNTVKECCILHSLSLYCGTVQMIRLGNDDQGNRSSHDLSLLLWHKLQSVSIPNPGNALYYWGCGIILTPNAFCTSLRWMLMRIKVSMTIAI